MVDSWLGKGHGSFAFTGTFQSAHGWDAPPRANYLAIGDITGDGRPDIATSNENSYI
jgi:hypothetical protein